MSNNQQVSNYFLKDRGVFSVSGEDVENFLQSLVTADILNLTDGDSCYATLLTPQGKILYDFFIYRVNVKKFLFDINISIIDEAIRRFSLYKLRSAIELQKLDKSVFHLSISCMDILSDSEGHIIKDSRLSRIGENYIRYICDDDYFKKHIMSKISTLGDFTEYEEFRLSKSIPDMSIDKIDNRSFPFDLGAFELGGISLTKGCYIGQEIIARFDRKLKELGHLGKKTLYRIHSVDGNELPPKGSIITLDGLEIGILRSHINDTGIAILRREQGDKATKNKSKLKIADEFVAQTSIAEWSK